LNVLPVLVGVRTSLHLQRAYAQLTLNGEDYHNKACSAKLFMEWFVSSISFV